MFNFAIHKFFFDEFCSLRFKTAIDFYFELKKKYVRFFIEYTMSKMKLDLFTNHFCTTEALDKMTFQLMTVWYSRFLVMVNEK